MPSWMILLILGFISIHSEPRLAIVTLKEDLAGIRSCLRPRATEAKDVFWMVYLRSKQEVEDAASSPANVGL